MSRFNNISIRDAEVVEDASGEFVYHVKDPHALIQAAGYIKHVYAFEKNEAIFFRGQTQLYGGLILSLFRGCTRGPARAKRIGLLKAKIKEIANNNSTFGKFEDIFHEPLLQHYGLRTTWIDLVDNIWIALWFACHKPRATGAGGLYMHFEQRQPIHFKDHVYILLVGAGFSDSDTSSPGFTVSKDTELVDLRVGAPSIFLRPHSQHGVLFRQRGNTVERPGDYKDQVRGIIRANLTDALDWIGSGSLLSVHSLFPPPTYDEGYRYLLTSNIAADDQLGCVSHIGA